MNNLQLRRLTNNELYQLTAIVDKETAEMARIEYPFNRDVANIFINEYNTWGIWLNGSILAGAFEIKEDCEVAYIVARQYRNIGIATQAMEMAIEFFADRQLFALIHPDNQASLRVAQKANMRVKFLQ